MKPNNNTVASKITDQFKDGADEHIDHEIVARIQQNDVSAFEHLMRRYNRILYRIARSIVCNDADAEDAVQEAYIKVFLKLSQLKQPDRLMGWLSAIVRNEALSKVRKDMKVVPIDQSTANHLVDKDEEQEGVAGGVGELPDLCAEVSQFYTLLEQAIDGLPEEFRLVFVLRGVEQLSTAETAQCLGIKESTVRTRFHRARKSIQASLDEWFSVSSTDVFPFAGERCDRIVNKVLNRINQLKSAKSIPKPLNRSAAFSFTLGERTMSYATGRYVVLSILVLLLLVMLGISTSHAATGPNYDRQVIRNTVSQFIEGRKIFRFDTFGDEHFWGGTLRLHEVIAGSQMGGQGPGISPATALAVGLKVDSDMLPRAIIRAIKRGDVDLGDPAVTITLLKLGAVVGLKGFFDDKGNMESLGITCALCHSDVNDVIVPGIGKRLDGWANRDLNVGLIISLALDLSPFSSLLGVDEETVKTVLTSWGPGKFDASLLLDGKAFRPDGKPAATLIPPAYGLAGINLHTWTGWGSVAHWNGLVAVLEMQGLGNFFDPRLKDPNKFPIAAENGFYNIRNANDQVTSKLAALNFYQLALPAPKAPRNSFDSNAAKKGKVLFNGKAQCADCHVPPLYTEPGWNLHKPEEIGIDSFQAMRSPEEGYRTSPLKGLWAHGTGGYYHDGRFPSLLDVVEHYDSHFSLSLSAEEQGYLVEFLKSL